MISSNGKRTFLLGLFLAVVTLGLYWQATDYEFVAFDDDQYVYQNPWVTSGLSMATIKWALTSTFAANWHPVTWISHLIDYSIYGPFAGGHHFTSILLHALNTALLFILLSRLTGALWPAALVAALFGWHPLRVESVAWIAERKDVLSALFFMLTLWAYARAKLSTPHSSLFTQNWLALVFFALGLMSKPMVVTLPFVLLLLDYWPLGRMSEARGRRTEVGGQKSDWKRMVIEKVPFFILSAGAAWITVVAQHAGGAIKSFKQVSFAARAAHVPVSYVTYILKTIWPSRLCAFYPLPGESPAAEVLCSILVLFGITAMAVHWRRRCPWLIVGWLWFLGTLVPVIGIVQVGAQAVADRFAYIPSIGLFLMFAWSANYWVIQRPRIRPWICGFAGVCLMGCILKTEIQLPTWRDSMALYTQMLVVTENNAMAQNGLGAALAVAGRKDEAIYHYKECLRLNPASVHARYNLGIELANMGKLDEALAQFFEAIKLEPKSEQLHNNAGVVLAQQGKTDMALLQFKQSIQLNPIYPKPYVNVAMAFEKTGDFAGAVSNYNRALQLEPDSTQTLDKLALLLATCPDLKLRNPAAAMQLASQACKLTQSEAPQYLSTLAAAYASAGRYSDAITTAELARSKAVSQGLNDLAASLARDLQNYRASH